MNQTVTEPTTVEPTPTEPTTTAQPSTLISSNEPPSEPTEDPWEAWTADAITLPEGADIDEEALASFVDLANTEQVSVETAAKFVEMHESLMAKASDAISKTYEDMQMQWQEEAKADPEFGGDKLAPTLGGIKQMITEVAGDKAEAVFEALDMTGAGNHPALINLLGKLAKSYAEGAATPGTAPSTAPKSLAERMYPNQGR